MAIEVEQDSEVLSCLKQSVFIRASVCKILYAEATEHKEGVSYLHRTATTAYPCYLPVLGEFSGSWSYKTYPSRKSKNKNETANNFFKNLKGCLAVFAVEVFLFDSEKILCGLIQLVTENLSYFRQKKKRSMIKLKFHNKEELSAFIRLLQEIVLSLEAEHLAESDAFARFEISARIELLEELLSKVEKKQFNQQQKTSVNISKAVALIIFQNRDIVLDVYAEMLKNRIVENIHREMV